MVYYGYFLKYTFCFKTDTFLLCTMKLQTQMIIHLSHHARKLSYYNIMFLLSFYVPIKRTKGPISKQHIVLILKMCVFIHKQPQIYMGHSTTIMHKIMQFYNKQVFGKWFIISTCLSLHAAVLSANSCNPFSLHKLDFIFVSKVVKKVLLTYTCSS